MFDLVDGENNPELGSIFMHTEKNRKFICGGKCRAQNQAPEICCPMYTQ